MNNDEVEFKRVRFVVPGLVRGTNKASIYFY